MMPTVYIAGLAAAASLALGFASGWKAQGWRAAGQIEALRADLHRAKGEHAWAVAEAASAALAQSEAHRQTEAALLRRVQEANHARTQERAALTARAAAADRDAVGLRHALDAYTCAAPGAPAGDTRAASSDPAPSLGELLGEVLPGYRAAVVAAEDHAADVRGLLAGWPRAAGEVRP